MNVDRMSDEEWASYKVRWKLEDEVRALRIALAALVEACELWAGPEMDGIQMLPRRVAKVLPAAKDLLS